MFLLFLLVFVLFLARVFVAAFVSEVTLASIIVLPSQFLLFAKLFLAPFVVFLSAANFRGEFASKL